jgi:hypothetical protein
MMHMSVDLWRLTWTSIGNGNDLPASLSTSTHGLTCGQLTDVCMHHRRCHVSHVTLVATSGFNTTGALERFSTIALTLIQQYPPPLQLGFLHLI